MKNIKRLAQRRSAVTLKPRNPVIAALNAGLGARSGRHGKDRGAQRRAEKMAIGKQASEVE
jgi:hypothetical protein